MIDFASELQGEHVLEEEWLTLYVVGSSNMKGVEVGIVLKEQMTF